MAPYSKVTKTLDPLDYVTFGVMLLISAAIGVYYAIVDRKAQSTTQGYFLGGRKLHPIPVAFSLMASFISAPIMLGGPAEVYTQGTMVFYIEVAIILSLFLATSTFIPLFLKLEITSIFEVFVLCFNIHFDKLKRGKM